MHDVSGYRAAVLGSAGYINHWLREATAFAERHRKELERLPMWLFSSGPLGSQQIDEDSTDVVQAARPREFDELQPMLHPRGAKVYLGGLGSVSATDRPWRAAGAGHARRS